MHSPNPILHDADTVGVVQHIDTVNRELVVLVDGDELIVDVPVGCIILLHRERIKLRLVQPGDSVHITHMRRGALLVARTMLVQPQYSR